MSRAVSESLPTLKSTKRPAESLGSGRMKRRDMKLQQKDVSSGGCAGEDDEKVEVERKIESLQRIVPGGESLGLDRLFEETAGYIIALQCQVKALRTLTSLFESLEKEKRKRKRKFGG